MGLASAINAAETASIQGVDLYGQEQQRLASTLEFHSRLLLPGAKAPKLVCDGNVTLGQLPTFEIGYHALHTRPGSPPMTSTWQHLVTTVRKSADPINPFMIIYETLTHGDTS